MIGQTNNPLLAKTEQQITSKIKPQMQQAFLSAAHAGGVLLYSQQVQSRIMSQINSTPNPIDNAAQAAANLTGVLIKQSGGKMPTQIAVPVSTLMLCEILDLLEKLGKVQVTPDNLAQATQLLGNYILRTLGINQDQVHQVMAHTMSQAQSGKANGAAPTQPSAPQSPQSGGIIKSAMGAQ